MSFDLAWGQFHFHASNVADGSGRLHELGGSLLWNGLRPASYKVGSCTLQIPLPVWASLEAAASSW